jgi:hypothetical protein
VSEVSLKVANALALKTMSTLLARLLRDRAKSFWIVLWCCHAEKHSVRIFSRFYVTYLLLTLWYLQVDLILPCHSRTAFFLSFA